jgi:hypothetical protein
MQQVNRRCWLIGLDEVCAYVGMRPRTVAEWRKKHGFPLWKQDGQWQTNTALIDAWIASRNPWRPVPGYRM